MNLSRSHKIEYLPSRPARKSQGSGGKEAKPVEAHSNIDAVFSCVGFSRACTIENDLTNRADELRFGHSLAKI
jgi:hypothetical protein